MFSVPESDVCLLMMRLLLGSGWGRCWPARDLCPQDQLQLINQHTSFTSVKWEIYVVDANATVGSTVACCHCCLLLINKPSMTLNSGGCIFIIIFIVKIALSPQLLAVQAWCGIKGPSALIFWEGRCSGNCNINGSGWGWCLDAAADVESNCLGIF